VTEFTYSRFLVPWLCGFRGRALFVDADVLCVADVSPLFHVEHYQEAVCVVPHAIAFERPSVMLFNCGQCGMLTPDYVNDPKHGLFDMAWAQSIGALPHEWNVLIDYENKATSSAKLLHYTKGIPIWPETMALPQAGTWHTVFKHMNGSVTFQELMGPSRHVITKAG
jgi:lipopolysaccharide biosynthesis glycosyltransferase